MLRAILRQHIADHNSGANEEQYTTIDFENAEIEAALRRGGRGPMGFEKTNLVGVEVLMQDQAASPPKPPPVDIRFGQA